MKKNDYYEVDGCTAFIPVKLIEEHKHMTNTLEVELTQTGYKTFVPIIYSFPIVNEPQKPVVPKFVAEWIGYCKFKGFTLLGALDPVSELGVGLVTSLTEELRKGKDWAQRNQETFTRAWLYGYEIEQEKFYTVEIPNPNGSGYSKIYLARNKDGKVELFIWSCYTSIEFADDWKQEDNAQLTEAEIKEDFEWAWQFAKEVEEL